MGGSVNAVGVAVEEGATREGVLQGVLYQPAAVDHVVSALPLVLPSPCTQAKLQAHRDAEKQLKDKLKEVGQCGVGGMGQPFRSIAT